MLKVMVEAGGGRAKYICQRSFTGTGEMAQGIEPHQHKHKSLDPQNPHKSWASMVARL